MIDNSALENRLNAVKEGAPIPEPPKIENPLAEYFPKKVDLLDFFALEAYKIFQVLLTSILYGYGIKAIFSQDWSFIELFGVGLITNHIFLNIINFASKLFKK